MLRIRKRNKRRKPRGLSTVMRSVSWKTVKHRLASILRWTAVTAAVAAALGIGYLTYKRLVASSYFSVAEVEVTRAPHVDRDAVLALLDIRQERNLLKIDTARLEARIEAHPWVKHATVQKVLPRRLRVTIEEFKPEAYVVLGRLYLVDGQGQIFKQADFEDNFELPIITGIDTEELRAEPGRSAARRKIQQALAIAREYRLMGLSEADRIGEVHFSPENGIIITTARLGLQIHLGIRGHIANLKRLKTVLSDLRRRTKTPRSIYLDGERHPERVVVRFGTAREQIARAKSISPHRIPKEKQKKAFDFNEELLP